MIPLLAKSNLVTLSLEREVSSVVPESVEECLDPLRGDRVGAEDEAHGEEDGPVRRVLQEGEEVGGQDPRLLHDLQAANVDEGGGQRPRVVQHVVSVDQNPRQITCYRRVGTYLKGLSHKNLTPMLVYIHCPKALLVRIVCQSIKIKFVSGTVNKLH